MEEIVIGPRKLLLAMLFTLVAAGLVPASQAADIYFAQTAQGGDNGADCADAYGYNDATHGVNNNQSATFSAGNTIHICGNWISSTNGQQWIQSNLGGTSASPITIHFEANAGLYAPYHSAMGAIAIQGQYYVIDGGTNGIIANTLNGTNGYAGCLGTNLTGGVNCTQQNQNTRAVYLQASNIEVKNLTIEYFYVIQPGSGDSNANSDGIEGIIFWPGGPYSNITVDHNTIHDMNHGIDGYGNTILVDFNEVYNCGRCILAGPGTVVSNMVYHDNIVHDLGIFNGTGVHEDGFHLFPSSPGQEIDGLMLYNNYLYNPGVDNTALIYLEGQFGNLSGGTAPKIFNNLCVLAASQADFCLEAGMDSGQTVSNTGALIANNTCIGGEYGPTSYSCFSIGSQSGASNWTNVNYENNVHVLGGQMGTIAGLPTIGSGTTLGTLNNNMYENVEADTGDSNGFAYHGATYATLNNWQAATGQDSAAVYDKLSNLAISLTTGQLQSGSPAIQAAVNLTSLGITALNCDKPLVVGPNGTGVCNSRPATGAWDIGAYQFSSNDGPPNPPTGLTAVVQ
jgi:hypothetical protein